MQVNELASVPPSVQAFVSPVSVSVTDRVSTAVVPSFTEGVVSLDEYVGVWSLTSVTVTAYVVDEASLAPSPTVIVYA